MVVETKEKDFLKKMLQFSHLLIRGLIEGLGHN